MLSVGPPLCASVDRKLTFCKLSLNQDTYLFLTIQLERLHCVDKVSLRWEMCRFCVACVCLHACVCVCLCVCVRTRTCAHLETHWCSWAILLYHKYLAVFSEAESHTDFWFRFISVISGQPLSKDLWRHSCDMLLLLLLILRFRYPFDLMLFYPRLISQLEVCGCAEWILFSSAQFLCPYSLHLWHSPTPAPAPTPVPNQCRGKPCANGNKRSHSVLPPSPLHLLVFSHHTGLDDCFQSLLIKK